MQRVAPTVLTTFCTVLAVEQIPHGVRGHSISRAGIQTKHAEREQLSRDAPSYARPVARTALS